MKSSELIRFPGFTYVFQALLSGTESTLTNRVPRPGSLASRFRNSEHASTARPVGVLELRRVGFCTGSTSSGQPGKIPAPAYQRKTGIYNTLHKAGQTYKADKPVHFPKQATESLFVGIQQSALNTQPVSVREPGLADMLRTDCLVPNPTAVPHPSSGCAPQTPIHPRFHR